MGASSIAALNRLPDDEKFEIYSRFIPSELINKFNLDPSFRQLLEKDFLEIKCKPGRTDVVLELRHEPHFVDPVLYAHLTDTMNGQIHVLLYIVNDPFSERFNTDRMPDGTPTEFGVFRRNIEEEVKAMNAGLAPGQVRRGLRMLRDAVHAFEQFVENLGHDVYFIDPLSYHNAIVFERYGFNYQQGKKKMESIHEGFASGGAYHSQLDHSTPFRIPPFSSSIRGRSWAIHDDILGEPFTDVVMYKALGEHAGLETFPGAVW
jgi:hypothetical protein